METSHYSTLFLEYLGKSAVVIALGFLALVLLRKFAPDIKHRIWLHVFLACVGIPLLLLAFPRWEMLPDFRNAQPTAKFAEPAPIVFLDTTDSSDNYTPLAVEPLPNPPAEFRIPWILILTSLWGVGVVVVLLRSAVAGIFLRKIQRNASAAPEDVMTKLEALQSSLKLRWPVSLLISPQVHSPFTWGVLRPRIVLPEAAGSWNSADLEMILIHELEHVQRNDAFAVLISRIFLALNWINPFAWIAIQRASQYREEACDQQVINAGFSSESYAEMLFRQAKITSAPILKTCATAVAETGTIEKRIKMILNHSSLHPRDKSPVASRLVGAFVLTAVFVIGISGCSDGEPDVAEGEAIPKEAPSENTEAVGDTGNIERKLKEIIIPSIEFSDTPLRDALAFLQQLSVELDVKETDPARKGFNIVSNAEGTGDIRITLRLSNVPIVEALRYTTSLAQLKYKVEPNAVVILPIFVTNQDLFTNTYQVPPTFLKIGSSMATTAKEILEEAGILFPPGGSAIYNPKSSHLIVRNTTDQMEVVEIFLESIASQEPVSPQIDANLKKIESITLPSVEFVDTPIMDAVAFLRARSVELDTLESDPAKKGINIVVGKGKIRDAKLSMRLVNVPLSEALRYTAELAGGGLKVDAHAVVISPEKSSARVKELSPDSKAKIAANQKKLTDIILPHIEFAGTPFRDAIQFLQQRSVELDSAESDPAKKGINVVLSTPQPDGGGDVFSSVTEKKDATIDLKLSNVPLSEAFRYTCDLAEMEYKVEPHNLVISPKKSKP